jgi:hypothetical protein
MQRIHIVLSLFVTTCFAFASYPPSSVGSSNGRPETRGIRSETGFQEKNDVRQSNDDSGIKLQVFPEFDRIEPAIASFEILNGSGADLSLEEVSLSVILYVPNKDMSIRERQSFSGQIYLYQRLPGSEGLRGEYFVGVETEKLLAGRHLKFKADLSKLDWSRITSSATEQCQLFELVPQGNYMLSFEATLPRDSGGGVTWIVSNQVPTALFSNKKSEK